MRPARPLAVVAVAAVAVALAIAVGGGTPTEREAAPSTAPSTLPAGGMPLTPGEVTVVRSLGADEETEGAAFAVLAPADDGQERERWIVVQADANLCLIVPSGERECKPRSVYDERGLDLRDGDLFKGIAPPQFVEVMLDVGPDRSLPTPISRIEGGLWRLREPEPGAGSVELHRADEAIVRPLVTP